ncbi:hypothetical protein D1814_10895 [Alteromonas sp. BL110]|uniref:hypothetical protein n=1 Tax=Alteromonas sp. BL110 TaxID=1714845 RepID=UPI000E4865E1|nr:hypothetical protein [Alteromonas sp. BL110]AXT39152.1 hypothetical protein D1814_10895 [Alteromonas sp. BL110]RKM85192.1 hypothetical protein D7031_00195 [Alteromonas sp. BL110]
MGHQLSAIFVTYEMIESALQNIERLLLSVPTANIILVDNSPQEYKDKDIYKNTLERIPSKVTYLENDKNSRFTAYNLALTTVSSGRVVFRTDDDVFNESVTAKVATASWRGFAVTPHKFDGQLQVKRDHQRPLETCVFDHTFLKELLPFEDTASADWKLLKRAYDKQRPETFAEVILHKIGHGREMSA